MKDSFGQTMREPKHSKKQIRKEENEKLKKAKEFAKIKERYGLVFEYTAGNFRYHLAAPHLSANANGLSVASKFYQFQLNKPKYLKDLEASHLDEFMAKIETISSEDFSEDVVDVILYQQLSKLSETISKIVHDIAGKDFSEDFIDGYLSYLNEEVYYRVASEKKCWLN